MPWSFMIGHKKFKVLYLLWSLIPERCFDYMYIYFNSNILSIENINMVPFSAKVNSHDHSHTVFLPSLLCPFKRKISTWIYIYIYSSLILQFGKQFQKILSFNSHSNMYIHYLIANKQRFVSPTTFITAFLSCLPPWFTSLPRRPLSSVASTRIIEHVVKCTLYLINIVGLY